MPRKPQPDVGTCPCPTCRKTVPMRKDKRGRLYAVCSTCNADPNEYYLTNGRVHGPGGKPAEPVPASAAPRPDEMVVSPRPVPKKVRALQKAAQAEPVPDAENTANSGFLSDSELAPEPVPAGTGTDNVPAPRKSLDHYLESIGL